MAAATAPCPTIAAATAKLASAPLPPPLLMPRAQIYNYASRLGHSLMAVKSLLQFRPETRI